MLHVQVVTHEVAVHVWVFFFSSRRRHTRCHGVWSSDVCSSDLSPLRANATTDGVVRAPSELATTTGSRSEKRRVGEECRSRWAPDHLKKKIRLNKTNYSKYTSLAPRRPTAMSAGST